MKTFQEFSNTIKKGLGVLAEDCKSLREMVSIQQGQIKSLVASNEDLRAALMEVAKAFGEQIGANDISRAEIAELKASVADLTELVMSLAGEK